ncbi:hypothetical protein COY95_02890 [Candidatus Woesearchaeota archaeon CG_4_10_14_0_8_um_filter_47_5]|nr:MAG: hypothetical protein COY95_02890 [Candidatus Woesearchaeota archaeon CG_4_10_14_0_8_um_filter_47_5]
MKISISGMPGAGKSTVAKMLAANLGLRHYYMGGIRRTIAAGRGMTLEEFNTLGEKDFSTDKVVDEYQEKLGREEDNFIIEGRTSYFLIPDSFKVFLEVDLREGAGRIFKELHESDARNEGSFASEKEMLASLRRRLASDRKRYMKYYNRDCFDHANFDLVVDTTKLTPEQVVGRILEALRRAHVE